MITNRELLEECKRNGYYCDECDSEKVCKAFQKANSLYRPYEVIRILHAQEVSGIDFRDKKWLEKDVPGKEITNRELITRCIGITNCNADCDRIHECNIFKLNMCEPWDVGKLLLSGCQFSDAWLDAEVEE